DAGIDVPGENLAPRFFDTPRTQRIRRTRPSKRRRRSVPAFRERGRRPGRLKRSLGNIPVDALQDTPGSIGQARNCRFELSGSGHAKSELLLRSVFSVLRHAPGRGDYSVSGRTIRVLRLVFSGLRDGLSRNISSELAEADLGRPGAGGARAGLLPSSFYISVVGAELARPDGGASSAPT